MKKIGFIGMGVMGAPMAGHLAQAGNQVRVWNRTPGKSAKATAKGAKAVDSIAQLAAESDVVISCVGTTEDVAEVLSLAADHAPKGALFIDHSTILPDGAVEIGRRLAALGMRFVDAPITGGSMGAENGTLTIFLGGEKPAVDEALQVVQPYAKRAEHVGGSGAGQQMKMANQIAVAGNVLGLCESLAFAKRSGLDIEQAKAMIGAGAGGNWAFENYGPKILNKDWKPGFSVKNQHKDFNYCERAAQGVGLDIPMTVLANELMRRLIAEGREEDTTAALFELYLGE